MKKYILIATMAVLSSCASIDDKNAVPNYQKAVADDRK